MAAKRHKEAQKKAQGGAARVEPEDALFAGLVAEPVGVMAGRTSAAGGGEARERSATAGECARGAAGAGGAKRGRGAGAEGAAYAVLQVADFALQAVLRLERGMETQAVALFGDRGKRGAGFPSAAGEGRQEGGAAAVAEGSMEASARVIACTAAARAAGVEPGQTVPQALARCAGLGVRAVRPAAEAEARAGLLAAALTVSPQIEDTAPGVCTIEVTALAAAKRAAALRAAVEQLAKLGLRATAGLAGTPWLAGLAARGGELGVPSGGGGREGGEGGRLGEPSLPARGRPMGEMRGEAGGWAEAAAGSASGRGGGAQARPGTATGTGATGDGEVGGQDDRAARTSPTGTSGSTWAWWCDGDGRAAELGRDFLRELPVAVAEPPEGIAEILAGWGVRTLGDLTALPKAAVARRLGATGAVLWERAAGEGMRPLRVWAPAPTFFAELALENEVETLEPLLFLLRRFVDRLALELRAAGFVAGELTLGLKLSDETGYERAFRLPEPTAREEIWFRVLHTHLESLQTAATVCGVSLRCAPVRPLVRQQGIFESALRDPHGFAETLGRVAAVVGAERVGTPVLEDTHRADAVRLEAPAGVVPATGGREPVHPRRGLPLRRWRPAVPATVELAADGVAPAFVWAEGVRGAVGACAGPWRSSGEWWEEGRAWRREEWDVELGGGGLYRLLHVPEGWFVEGEYD